jgi:magnesium transporter
MLALYTCTPDGGYLAVNSSVAAMPPEVVWIDLLNADAKEISFVERSTGLHVPALDELSEIESSSRLRLDNHALYLSAPMISRAESEPRTTPVGFVFTKDLLITVRFETFTTFQAFVERSAKSDEPNRGSVDAFTGLMDTIVDRMADVLEVVESELDAVSRRIFRTGVDDAAGRRRPARENADLRKILRRVGGAGDLVSKIRDSLLGIGRILPYVMSQATDWLSADVKQRLETIRQDVVSLNDYDAHLVNKVQLLLDATLGLINVEQNNIIKVLTIVSVIGVPPTLVASLYGMNFKYMPELNWAWGYPYAIGLIGLSAIVPLLWFKLRGWL